MGKRFTDTEKWKKPWLRGLPMELKVAWFYILDDCDVAGLWQVDWEVLQIRTGCTSTEAQALEALGKQVIVVDGGTKWFIPSFIEFQYGPQLSKTNNIYKSICRVLDRHDLWKHLTVPITDEGTTAGAIRGRISQKTREAIFVGADLTCEYCQERKSISELTVDHFLPIQLGGTNADENLICCCRRCNGHKTDLHPCDFLSRNHAFLKPTDKIKSLNKILEGAFKDQQGPKDKDMDKVRVNGQGQSERQGGAGGFEANFRTAFDERTMENYFMQFKHLDVVNELVLFRIKCNGNPTEYHNRDPGGLRTAFLYQLKNAPIPNQKRKPQGGADLTSL